MAYQLTALGISVLGLLRERPMHGYQMFQTFVERQQDRIVKIRPGSLYHVVDRLAEEKFIRRVATNRDGNRPERVVYEITDAGVEALADRVRELVAAPVNEFPRLAAALAEIRNLDLNTAVDAVASRVAALEASLADLVALRDAGITPSIDAVALDYLQSMTQAELTWLRGLMDWLRSGQSQWPGGQRPDTIVVSRSEVRT